MAMLDRLEPILETAKQREFENDFRAGAEHYDVWDEVEIGRQYDGTLEFTVLEEDILAFNRSMLETDPLFVDADYAREHSPTGELLQHPLFLVEIGFYCIEKGPGSWIRSPGARNPGQTIELTEPFRIGEKIRIRLTASDKWIRRDKHYLQYKIDYFNQDGAHKGIWWLQLILPPSREDLLRFATA